MPRLAVTVLLLVSACTAHPAKTSTTMAAYAAAVAPICRAAQQRIDTLVSPDSADLPAIKRFFESARDIAVDELRQLRAVPRPSAQSKQLTALYDAIAGVIKVLDKGAAAIAKSASTNVEEIAADVDARTASINARFDALGITACGAG